MMQQTIHQCPRCDGAIHRENFATSPVDGGVTSFLLCEFCGIGFETSDYHDHHVFRLDFRAATEPRNFQRFLKRLAAARCVGAPRDKRGRKVA